VVEQKLGTNVRFRHSPHTSDFAEVDFFTFSQNHRMVGVGRDLCGSSNPILLPKQGHLQQALAPIPFQADLSLARYNTMKAPPMCNCSKQNWV